MKLKVTLHQHCLASILGTGLIFSSAIADAQSSLNFEDSQTQHPELGFQTGTVGGGESFVIVAGMSNGDPGNWQLEGTSGARLLGFWGDWLGIKHQGYTGSGDAVYSAIYFKDPNTSAPFTTDVSFDVLVPNGNSSGTFIFYGFQNGNQVTSKTLSLSAVTVNGFSEYKDSVSFSGVDEIRFFSSAFGGMDNFTFTPAPEPSSLALGALGFCGLLFVRKRRKL